MRDILCYLKDLLDRGRAFSPLGQQPLEGSFMQGVCRKCLVSRLLVPFDAFGECGIEVSLTHNCFALSSESGGVRELSTVCPACSKVCLCPVKALCLKV